MKVNILRGILLASGIMTAAMAADTAPATRAQASRPAMQTAQVTVDQSNPKAALRTFIKAIQAGDDSAARTVIETTDENQQAATTCVRLMLATAKLQHVA